MPEPDIFLQFMGVSVYHCHDDDGAMAEFWYTTQANDCNIDSPAGSQFDVRDLYVELKNVHNSSHREIIMEGIKKEIIK